MADRGDTWILQVQERTFGPWTEYPGEGYNGTSAWRHAGAAGDSSRIYWKMDHPAIPNSVELYTIEFYDPAVGADGDYQVIESMLHDTYEGWPYEPDIPWNGAWGTNHQWIKAESSPQTAGQFVPTGPGPQAPESEEYFAGGSGIYMWLERNSRLYAKWDFSWSIDRTWSVLRIRQETGAYRGDFSDPRDDDVDVSDFSFFQACFSGPNRPLALVECVPTDFDGDADTDLSDFALFQSCFNGPNRAPACP